MIRRLAVLSSLAGLLDTACATEPAKVQAPPVVRAGKPQAPVEISSTPGATSARVELVFLGAASGVTVEVAGVEGLRVTSPNTPVSGAEFVAGGVTTFDVTYEAPGGESTLAVFVTGKFGGAPSTKAASFAVGKPSPLQMQKALKAQEAVQVDSKGERIHVVPADRN
jgi:hypothetical protein